MARQRIFPILALCLALLVGTGAARPSPWLWQCRHSSRLAEAPFAAHGTMPCRMGAGKRMPGAMSCCAPNRLAPARSPRGLQSLSSPTCTPTFVPLMVPSPAALGQTPSDLHQGIADACALSLSSEGIIPLPVTTSLRQRPPPDAGLRLSDLLHVPGLRAPPVA